MHMYIISSLRLSFHLDTERLYVQNYKFSLSDYTFYKIQSSCNPSQLLKHKLD